ncbi:unnamed protein product [Taenia asiatica]|uniref:Uncharacterized protein n=1 Tax=Taenia asiatica TaxID=60517 RepID=A0A0R3WG75_TAEAS|nr:unnamed protein product [Taenia asiatica]
MSESPNPPAETKRSSPTTVLDVIVADSLEKSVEDNGEQDHKHKHGKRLKKGHDSAGQPHSEAPDQQHVMFLLGEQHADEEPHQSPAFVELDELYTDPTSTNPPEWREVARYVFFKT